MLRDVTIAQDRLAGAGQKLAQPVTENQGCPRKRDCKNSTGLHYRKAKPERITRDLTIGKRNRKELGVTWQWCKIDCQAWPKWNGT